MKTATLETAKQLRELGFPQESHFWWKKQSINNQKGWWLSQEKPVDYPGHGFCAAPTAEEVLDQLPMNLDGTYYLIIERDALSPELWSVGYMDEDYTAHPQLHGEDKVLAEAAAKTWFYLKNNNLL